MAYSSWAQNMNSSRFQRQQCYLCDFPRAPWAILNDFSEPICRGCCNYEGPDRIETVIDYVRSLRKGWEHQVRSLKQQNLNSTGTSIGSSPSPGGHSNGSMDAVVSMAGTPYPFGQYHNLIPHHAAEHIRFMHSVKPEQTQHASSDGPPENFVPKSPFVVPSEPASQSVVVGPRSADEAAHEEHRRFMASIATGKDVPPRMPIIRRPPEYSEYPEVVRETLEILNSCVPFDVRFKKEHNHVGRVFVFEAAPRAGAATSNEYELKIHIEYPRGSENFCQSASSVAKQMYQDSMKEFGRGLSSGFKYLEYEVQGSPNEWRLLGDLLPEHIRVFKEPIARNFLPQRLTEHPTFHPMLGPPVYGPKFRSKRKADDIEPPGVPSRAPRRTYKEREDEQIQRHLWMQSQVDALRLSMAHLTGPPDTNMHLNSVRAATMLEHQRHPAPLPHAPLTPGSQPPTPHQPSPKAPWGVPSSMAALISAASAETNPNSVKESRKLSLSENGKSKSPINVEKDLNEVNEENSNNIKTEDSSERKDSDIHTKKTGPKSVSQLKCSNCDDWLEDTHFVQCPSVTCHKFCFPCSKESIKKQGFGNDVFCPSGKRCPLIGSNLPWAFMQTEIKTILGTSGRPKPSPKDDTMEEEKS